MLTATDKARLAWHCRRGMLELDLILQRFLETQLDVLEPNQIKAFNALLDHTDPELFAWFMGHEQPPSEELKEIVAIISNNN